MIKVNKSQYSKRGAGTNKTTIKKIGNFIFFIALVNLPFLTITQQIGLDVFLDSFENPDYYQYTQETTLQSIERSHEPSLILIQKASHPTFSIQEGDIALYATTYERIIYDTTNKQTKTYQIHTYYSTLYTPEKTKPIPGYSLMGKIIVKLDDNIWNAISLKTWESSIKILNINALFNGE